MLGRFFYVLGGLLLVLLLLCGGGYYYLIRAPLPALEGELQVSGLEAAVTVVRDRWGVPHIYADSLHDLLMAQGFVQAQDRLWQMEINRRLAAGRLSEGFGEEALEVDRLLRTFGLMRAAEKEVASYDQESQALLQAFADGVNAFLESRHGRLPVEFRLLGLVPEPWRPADSIGWAKMMALMGARNWQEEIVRAMLSQRLGADLRAALPGLDLQGGPQIIPEGLDLSALLPPRGLDCGIPQARGLAGSNNWTVHGARTRSGFPLLANDMHLQVGIPSVWYEIHLAGAGLDVVGLSLPGVPLVIAGHNRDLAWGITFGYTDCQDVFLERLSPDRSGRYLYQGEWLEVERIEEPIRVKGREAPVIHEVWRTRHGPILSPHVPRARLGDYALALKWSGHDPGGMVPVLKRMNLARDGETFKAAAQLWAEPAINLVYADREGNIGYVLGSRVPLRAGGHGRGPFPGWTGAHEWTGYLAPEEKPAVKNPPQGFLVTANNRVVAERYPHYLAEDYRAGFRAARIAQVLSVGGKLTRTDLARLQGDLLCPPAAGFLEALAGREVQGPVARDLMDRLAAWDRVMAPASPGAAIYAVLLQRLMENTFQDEMGPLTDLFLGQGLTVLTPLSNFIDYGPLALLHLLADPNSPWFDDTQTKEREGLSEQLEKSLSETGAFLESRLGKDPATWRWGRLHRMEIAHPFGRVKALAPFFNRGPYEVGGHFCTVWQAAVHPGMDFSLQGWTASNRHIYDLEDWDESLAAIVPGQSGMPGSQHYDDQVEAWLQVGHHPLYYSKARVDAAARHVLTLRP